MRRGQEFAEIAHRILTSDDRFSLKDAAQSMSMTYETLYSRVRGRSCFSADEIRQLLRYAPDPRLCAYFLDGTKYIAAERIPAIAAGYGDTVVNSAHRVVFEAADVLQAIELALHDQKIDHRDALMINKEIESAERVLIGLREHLNQIFCNVKK